MSDFTPLDQIKVSIEHMEALLDIESQTGLTVEAQIRYAILLWLEQRNANPSKKR
jgi:hypothetical protein